MANTCDNDLYIEGIEADIKTLTTWINSQTNDQAPNPAWAALYNLETSADSTDGIGVVSSGSADHAYGDADYSAGESSATFQWTSKNNPSIDAVIQLAKKFPILAFKLRYNEPGYGLSGELICKKGKVDSYEGGYKDDSESDWSGSEEESSEAPI